jgi:hypothetical protein
MLNRFLLLGCGLLIALGLFAVPFPEGPTALAFTAVLSAVAVLLFRRYTKEKEFITTVFLSGLILRMAFGLIIHIFELRPFFGGDALAYDVNGWATVNFWLGRNLETNTLIFQNDPASGAGWGMNYITAGIYLILGRNILAAQSFCCVLGAATGPMIYYCSLKIFNNLKVARVAALGVAIFPSFVIWSGQLLKDGLIIFMLVTAMTMVLQLQEKISYSAVAILIISLFGILSLRFYIFYMAVIAVVGSFVVGVSKSNKSIFRRTVVLVLLGFGLSYLGVGRNAEVELPTFANLDRIQSSRSDLARAAGSGFNEEVDVSTTEGALTAIPTGFMYLMLAPFPWQASNLRQAITIPEVLVWWLMIPFVISGLIYTVRHRLRNAFPVLIFSLLLTISYSVFQGNVGTAYRQRTQIQVFLFIMMGVGWTVYQERKENDRLIRTTAQKKVDAQLRGFRSPKPMDQDADSGIKELAGIHIPEVSGK